MGVFYTFREHTPIYGTQGRIDLVNRQVIRQGAVQSPISQTLAQSLTQELAELGDDKLLCIHLNNWLSSVQLRRNSRLGMDAAYRQARLVDLVSKALGPSIVVWLVCLISEFAIS